MNIDLFSIVVLSIASAYIIGFFLVCPIGMMRESVKKAVIVHWILERLNREPMVIFTKQDMDSLVYDHLVYNPLDQNVPCCCKFTAENSQHDHKSKENLLCDRTLGGIIDEMVRSGDIARKPNIAQNQSNIVRHSA